MFNFLTLFAKEEILESRSSIVVRWAQQVNRAVGTAGKVRHLSHYFPYITDGCAPDSRSMYDMTAHMDIKPDISQLQAQHMGGMAIDTSNRFYDHQHYNAHMMNSGMHSPMSSIGSPG